MAIAVTKVRAIGLCLAGVGVLCSLLAAWAAAAEPPKQTRTEPDASVTKLLDAPLLFVKRHSYTGIHIYDTYYKWPPGGGGIYVLENPSAPRSQWKIRPVIDPTTPGTLGLGVYTHPELSWDAKRLLFCFKGEPTGSTSIYEIGIDGRGLRRLTDPRVACSCYKGGHGGQHDIAPAYLPDGRIVFLSTRPSGLVPCANSGVSILHVMNADGSDMHPISVNNVNEFDPSILPDGRILFGRWEYVDKNALTIQSLWTINPDGTQETAVYANNMVFPEAVLDARHVPGTQLIVGTFAKHNSTPRGSIALIDPRLGKNNPRAAINLEHPDDPTFDRGDSCEPWPVTADVFLFSGRRPGYTRNEIEIIDRAGRRSTLLGDPLICLHSPMLVKPRPVPAVIADTTDRTARTGRFFLQDIYQGLTGVKRGEVKHLRVIEETSRVSPTTMGGSPFNQTFLVSAALAFSVKTFQGTVPVAEDGSAYFEVPSGRAVYLQALDAEGRLIQSMRTFVQAAPGTTRSCIGCHEHKYTTTMNAVALRQSMNRTPSRLQPESWGSGYVDYPGMVQPILDKHCASCHGGEKGIAAGVDLSGAWTEYFNISYENLAARRQTQLIADWIAGIDCMNGTAWWSSQLFAPRKHGSGAAPLAQLLVSGHGGHIPNLSRPERDLLLAWIDSNGLYHGTWDYNPNGCAIKGWAQTKDALTAEMRAAGCLRCHGDGQRVAVFENDWINLQSPQLSRILRAPLGEGKSGFGLGLCRDRKADPQRQRTRLLWKGYAHAVQTLEYFAPQPFVPASREGNPVVSFASTDDPHYQKMLAILRGARQVALASPRVEMPGAEVLPGACRQFKAPPLPDPLPKLETVLGEDGVVNLFWERSARTIGLEVALHRADKDRFAPAEKTLLTQTSLFRHVDQAASAGTQHYALVFISDDQRSQPVYASVTVPPPAAPPMPVSLKSLAASYSVRLSWDAPETGRPLNYLVYRGKPGGSQLEKLTPTPLRETWFVDTSAEPRVEYAYAVRSVSQRGVESALTKPVTAAATVVHEPVFATTFGPGATAQFLDSPAQPGKLQGGARAAAGVLDVSRGGHVSFPHRSEFDLFQPLSVECWVWFDQQGKMPVIIGCGQWRQAGWFLQWLGGWRWHVGGVDCDGGRPVTGRWIHVVGTYDGRTARLFQDGQKVAECAAAANMAPWPGDLCIGQYSATPGPEYQTFGRITGVKIYHRPLDPAEIAATAQNKPQ